ncbi:MAG: SusD/RagB family nutrient-binding outer membrane lipoprotein [Bacteroidia bacterium]|nr:SusD/RagB family nutrient-binding outer membrane lipoprotein [Bacteroidia bacterium]
MKTFRNIVLFLAASLIIFSGCTKNFEDINKNPNAPVDVPTSTLMINAQKRLLDDIRDEWASGRMALLWVQYWAQVNYTEEDRYQPRQNVNNILFSSVYLDIVDLQRIIDICEDPEWTDLMAAYGNVQNQIATARILKTWAFQILTETYGPVPYHSYGAGNADFNALMAREDVYYPNYVDQEAIFLDMLNELKEAAAQIDVNQPAWTEGDNIFYGNALQWKKFANSLRLRIAMRLSAKAPAVSNAHIAEVLADGDIMSSNADVAAFKYGTTADNASPMYRAYFVENRTDFALAKPFVDLLKGDIGPFGLFDPRLPVYGSPNSAGEYAGQPYGVPNHVAASVPLTDVSLPNSPLAPDYAEPFMTYAEVCFILAEYNGWDQTWYENGVRASMEYNGVDAAAIEAYIDALPAANEENVITQKYIDLYMQPYNAWAEYRRTGYPTTFVLPGDFTGAVDPETGEDVYFEPLEPGVTDIIDRMNYAQEDQLLNPTGYAMGVEKLGGPDKFTTKLWIFE